ncbi:MAG: type III ribulose-bisphosphate carboxylase [Nanoarchaeota archaeon]|nr:type III ribulose-bisphosphate carboxylase [Nanoarchaeota archaeon]
MAKGYLHYINLGYKPKKDELIAVYKFKPRKGVGKKEAAGAIAAESSTGTWTTLSTMTLKRMTKIGAKVYKMYGDYAEIAYPLDLFELGNMPEILSSIAGNIFGMKEVDTIRLVDVKWPTKLKNSFKGPQFGIKGVRKLLGVKKRPLVGTIVKPKLGLTSKEHAKVAYEAWVGGLDIVKDDENLTSQPFNKFKKRVEETLKLKWKAEKETGERKMYMANVTAETREMLKRAKFLKDMGNEYAMVDILTVGFAGLQTLRDEMDKLKLVLHGHRAMHAALTRNPNHGISMSVLAEISRLIGTDQLHVGTAVGKMEGKKKDIIYIVDDVEGKFIRKRGHMLAENWGKIKPMFAVCSGGLHPGLVPPLVKMFGEDIIIQAGGGVHGHPRGTRKGATAMRQAVDATLRGVPLREYAKTHKELKEAIEKWGVYKG